MLGKNLSQMAWDNMCGITGFFNTDKRKNRREMHDIAKKMHEAIAHRGPDDADIWQDPENPLVLAHRRLSIIDLSEHGRQPMTSHSGRYVCVYNGEIYNFLDLRNTLVAAGHEFKGRSDTEIMLAAFDHWGINQALQKLNGMFAIALWDRQESVLHFIRDRFGKKPLYIGWAGNDLVFASELKSFHQHPDFKPVISHAGLSNYMHYGYLCAPYTIFENVWQLLPASRISIPTNRIKPLQDLNDLQETYWFIPRIVEEARTHTTQETTEDLIDEFDHRLKHAVKERMVSDVPLGAFLSGGIDSSVVSAIMQEQSNTPIKTYSIGFHDAQYNEAEHAKKIAQHLGTDHTEFYVDGTEALDVIPKLPEIYDEPFSDSSQIPTYLVSKHARKHVSVVLTGDGGDEILGGYQRHTHIPHAYRKMRYFPAPLRRSLGKMLAGMPENTLRKINPKHPQLAHRIQRMGHMLSQKTHNDIYDALLSRFPNPSGILLNPQDPNIPLHDPLWQARGLDMAETMMYGDNLSYRPNDLMVKTDRATMAHSLEARAPLMDHRLFEYAWSLPKDMKIRGLNGKWILREVLKRRIPQDLFDRPKMGFNVPIDNWLRGPLKDWAEALLAPERITAQGLFNPQEIEKIWTNHKAGHTNSTSGNQLWTILMFQIWHDRWMSK